MWGKTGGTQEEILDPDRSISRWAWVAPAPRADRERHGRHAMSRSVG